MKAQCFALVLALGIWPAGPVNAQTATFDFDTGVPALRIGESVPFDQTSGGVTAHFSSPSGPVFSIQSDASTGWRMSRFSGNYLYDNNLNRNILEIRFDQPLTAITLNVATADFQQVEIPTSVQITAYKDSAGTPAVGSATSHGTYASDTMPMGTLSFNAGGRVFNLIQIATVPQPQGTGVFLIDNLTVTLGTPAPVDVQPAFGSGLSQPMAFTFSDPAGWQDLGVVNILINNALDGRRACYLAYDQQSGVLYLVDDGGGTLLPGLVPTSGGTTNNSLCTVSWTDAALTTAGNTLSLTLTFGFSSSFAGNKVVYLAARNAAGTNSGWQSMGVWRVPGGITPVTTSVVGMAPARGSGLAQTAFTFRFSDSKGYQDLGVVNILVNDFLDGRHACYLAYARSINALYLMNDAGDALLPGQVLNTAGAVFNSQCTVTWGAAPVNPSGNDLALSLNIAFSAGFAGNRIFYLAARDRNESNSTGWQPAGTWEVP